MHDLHQLGLRRESALDRVEWRGLIGGKHPTRAERGQSDIKRDDDDDDDDLFTFFCDINSQCT